MLAMESEGNFMEVMRGLKKKKNLARLLADQFCAPHAVRLSRAREAHDIP